MNIITISREFGSGGREVGKRLAEYLGYDYYDKEIIKLISEKLQLDENFINNMSEQIIVQNFDFHFGYTLGSFSTREDSSIEILRAQTEIIHNIAKKGNNFVIIGRCADALLKDYNPLNIFVYADMNYKIDRCLERDKNDIKPTRKEIENQIKKIDKQRAKYCDFLGDGKWGERNRYHLLINTSGLEIKNIIKSIADFSTAYFNNKI